MDVVDEEIRKETRAMLAECNDITEDEVPEDWVTSSILDGLLVGLDDVRQNLDVNLDGHIVAFADLGLWNGRRHGYKRVGYNLADIFASSYGGDDVEFYADKYDVRCRASHHDGTNTVLFRFVSCEDWDKFCDDQISIDTLQRRSRSIRPFVARVYGLSQYGAHAHKRKAKASRDIVSFAA